MINKIEGYRKEYRVRLAQGMKKKSMEVTFPYEVVEREARKRGLSIPEFLNKFRAVAQYDNFDGVFYSFEKIPSEDGKA